MSYRKPDPPDIAAVLRHYGADTVPTGGGWRSMKCPFHGDSVASARVNTDVGAFKCHGCEMGGDAWSLIMEREGVGFREAVRIGEDFPAASSGTVRSGAPSRRPVPAGPRARRGGRHVPARLRRDT